jgi:hypothetical protein
MQDVCAGATQKRPYESLWDHLPYDLEVRILKEAGALTKFLYENPGRTNHDLKNILQSNKTLAAEIWADIFRNDDVGTLDLEIVSQCLTESTLPHIHNGLLDVRSHGMYHALCTRFPAKMNWTKEMKDRENIYYDKLKPVVSSFIHIPLRRMWLDIVNPKDIKTTSQLLAEVIFSGGHLDYVKHLFEQGHLVAVMGQLVIPRDDYHRFAHENSKRLLWAAIESGSVEVVEYLLGKGCVLDRQGLNVAALEGHIHLMKSVLHPNVDRQHYTSEVFLTAIKNDNVEICKFLTECNVPCEPWVMDEAAGYGSLESVKYLHTHRTEGCTTNAMDKAASQGRFEVVKFLHENRSEGCTTNAMDEAASRSFEIVEYLHRHRREGCTFQAFENAAFAGNLEIVRFLYDHYPDVPKGRPSGFLRSAVHHGDVELFKYLLHQPLYVEPPSTIFTVTVSYIINGDRHIRRQSGPQTDLEMIKYLHEQGAYDHKFHPDDLYAAAGDDRLPIFEWLLKNRTEGTIDKAMERATERMDHLAIKFLNEYKEKQPRVLE